MWILIGSWLDFSGRQDVDLDPGTQSDDYFLSYPHCEWATCSQVSQSRYVGVYPCNKCFLCCDSSRNTHMKFRRYENAVYVLGERHVCSLTKKKKKKGFLSLHTWRSCMQTEMYESRLSFAVLLSSLRSWREFTFDQCHNIAVRILSVWRVHG